MRRAHSFLWFGRGIWMSLMLGGVAVTIPRHANADTPPHPATVRKSSSQSSDTTLDHKKLDKILENQQTILHKLDAMMEELQIIKVRATR